MRLLVDAQCLQSTSSLRGIGRYSLNLLAALVRTAGEHRVEVLLGAGDDADRLLRARTALETFLPAGRVHVYDADWPFNAPDRPARRRAAEAAYSAAVASLAPDVLLVGSVFEGDPENVQTVDGSVPTAAVLYDLIPAADPGTYLLGPAAPEYWRRFEELKRCDLLLSISDYSAVQAHELLGAACPPTATVWGGPFPSGRFPSFEEQRDARPELDLPPRFLLTVGGDHPRKNLDRLVRAWGRVPAALRAGTALVVACGLNPGTVRRLQRVAARSGLADGELLLTGRVSDRRLDELYRGARAFVFPSTEEGLGMPPIEAMAAGCPTMLARSSSLVELTSDRAAFFDGDSDADVTAALVRLLTDDAHLDHLRAVAAAAAARLTWDATAERAWRALEELPLMEAPAPPAPFPVRPLDRAPAARGAALRAELAGTAVACSPATALDLLRAGAVDVPLVAPDEHALTAIHDPLLSLRPRLAPLDLEPDHRAAIVDALLFPARWTLQRPRAVWMLLDIPVEPALEKRAAQTDAVLLIGRGGDLALAESCDAVLVAAGDPNLPRLARARARGAIIVSVGPGETPAWCIPVTSVAEAADALAGSGRTTGWPWRA